jgi:hypothetical protein
MSHNTATGAPTMSEAELFILANYTAYLVRLWRESDHSPWRASTQCASTGEKVYFATLADLFKFLEAQTSIDEQVRL